MGHLGFEVETGKEWRDVDVNFDVFQYFPLWKGREFANVSFQKDVSQYGCLLVLPPTWSSTFA